MCIIAISYKQYDKFPLVIAVNRDEYFERPTRSIDWWPEDPKIMAGKDLRCNGTWMGLNQSGKFSAITNVRDVESTTSITDKSRGQLPLGFLQGSRSPVQYVQDVKAEADKYPGFNLFVGDLRDLYFISNRLDRFIKLEPGLHACSNGPLESGWPKVDKLKCVLSSCISEAGVNVEKLFGKLTDDSPAPVDQLPNTGVGSAVELALSPIFVKLNDYGTRNSTIAVYDCDKNVTIYNKDYVVGGRCINQSTHHFRL